MESQDNKYEPGADQNQGVVGEMARAEQTGTLDPTEVGISQDPQFDPNTVTNAEAAKQELGADTDDDNSSDNSSVYDDDTIVGTDEEQANFDGPDH